MGTALHPYIVGQPYHLRHLRRALQHVAAARDRGQLWMTTPGAICAHAMQEVDGENIQPRLTPAQISVNRQAEPRRANASENQCSSRVADRFVKNFAGC